MGTRENGFLLGLGAYVIWGFFPLYWPLLEPSGPIEVLAHRVAWSLAAVGALLMAARRWRALRNVLRSPRTLAYVAIGAVVIGANWVIFIWGVNNGHVVEVSLGYFINPLVTILMGVLLLGERLRPVQWAALAIAFVAVVQLTLDYGTLPWLALALAASFATYGLMKKKADIGAVEGLALETALLVPLAGNYLVFLHTTGGGTFGGNGWPHALLLAGTGLITVVPLLLFGGAATRVPMATLGLLQYVTPTLQFILGLVVFREQMTTARWIGFAMVWAALLLITSESLAHRRRVAVREPALV
ncbi:EamA family transporter RarD [Actinokineospora sp. UTMC 2448]|uniref:EamA family transporter RarD n=1 Tax=Actinokineospora sp. UTMC 2448 TaxID=2268449 RepID=UPI0021640A19|nr:EamA family transporter RarD [Actinokineospora sp. UTMC 2448]UVS82660.1 putative chloramphenical resistance permease RarD [Actinokineospora sp. UTMC 2448]